MASRRMDPGHHRRALLLSRRRGRCAAGRAAAGAVRRDGAGKRRERAWPAAGDRPLREELEARARALGVDARLHFLSAMPQHDLRRIYVAADALLLTSTREGWPNVVLESLACGTPVVATDVGAVPEMLTRPDA